MEREEFSVKAEIRGQSWSGYYATQSGMLTVWVPSVGSRTMWLGSLAASIAARELLVEIVRECRRFGRLAVSAPLRQGPR
jgi:hypothetical protein